ncbi:MAG: hypothetical protein Phog2KO_41330 [Phototrophicaceae bacterium]
MKKKNKKPNLLLRFVLPVLIFSCIVGACYLFAVFGAISLFQNECDPSEPTEFERLAEITLPSSYDNFHSVCFGLQGWVLKSRFDIKSDELEIFLNTTDIIMPLSQTELPSSVDTRHLEIDYSSLNSYLYGIYQDNTGWFEEIIVDTTHPNRWTVYFTVLR